MSKAYVSLKYPEWIAKYKIRVYRMGRKVLFNLRDIDEKMMPRLQVNPGVNEPPSEQTYYKRGFR